jgi:hypothetical protein
MTSEAAAQGWDKPIRLLWIDGDHRYEPAKLDFTLWEPFLVEAGILAMHDTIRKNGPKRVLWENVFRSGRFQEIAIVDNITAVRQGQPSLPPRTDSEQPDPCSTRNLHCRAEEQRAARQNHRPRATASIYASELATGHPLRLFRQHRSIMKVTPLRAVFLSLISRQ